VRGENRVWLSCRPVPDARDIPASREPAAIIELLSHAFRARVLPAARDRRTLGHCKKYATAKRLGKSETGAVDIATAARRQRYIPSLCPRLARISALNISFPARTLPKSLAVPSGTMRWTGRPRRFEHCDHRALAGSSHRPEHRICERKAYQRHEAYPDRRALGLLDMAALIYPKRSV
jgi:hypothetical protein